LEKNCNIPSPTYILPLPEGGGGFGESSLPPISSQRERRRKGNPSPTLILPLPEGGGGFGGGKGGEDLEGILFLSEGKGKLRREFPLYPLPSPTLVLPPSQRGEDLGGGGKRSPPPP